MRLVTDFLDPARRAQATHELAALGADAVPVVAAVLDGSSRNAFGVPYRTFGEALLCALVTTRLLGPIAAPLEPAVAAELVNSDPTIRREAAAALGQLPALSDTSVAMLGRMLEDEPDPAYEAAATILRRDLSGHFSVLDVVGRSAKAARVLHRTEEWMKKARSP